MKKVHFRLTFADNQCLDDVSMWWTITRLAVVSRARCRWFKPRPGQLSGSLITNATVKRATKKRATCFATLLQNELNNDVAGFTTDFRTCLPTNEVSRFFFTWVRKRATWLFKLVLQQCCKTTCTFFCCLFYRTLRRKCCLGVVKKPSNA